MTVPYDTLTLRERELLQVAAEKQIPLPLRIAEYGFAEAQAFKELGAAPGLREDAFQAFAASLADEGIPQELLEDQEILDYLAWRARISTADRMNRLGSSALTRMERDTVLAEAIRLLREYSTQPELFAAAAAMKPQGEVGDESTEAGAEGR